MTNENVSRWSGLAAAIGGPLWLLPWTGWLGDIGDAASFLIALTGMLLVGVGLLGLYRRIPAGPVSRRKTIIFSIAQGGIVLMMTSALVGLLTGVSPSNPDEIPSLAMMLGAGTLLLVFGLVGLGLITISAKALGGLSFAPLLLAISLLGYLLSVVIAESGNGSVRGIFDVLTMACWLLFGIALWTATEPVADPTPAL